MANPVNKGNQTQRIKFKQALTARNENQAFYDYLPKGVISGLTLTYSGNDVTVAPGQIFLQDDSNEIALKVETTTNWTFTVLEATPYIVCNYDWLDSETNYMDITQKAAGSLVSSDVILGEATFSVGAITGFDSSERDTSPFNNLSAKNGILQLSDMGSIDIPTGGEFLITIDGATHTALKVNSAYTGGATPAVEIGSVSIGTGSITSELLVRDSLGLSGVAPVIRAYDTDGTSGERGTFIDLSDGQFAFKSRSDDMASTTCFGLRINNDGVGHITTPAVEIGGTLIASSTTLYARLVVNGFQEIKSNSTARLYMTRADGSVNAKTFGILNFGSTIQCFFYNDDVAATNSFTLKFNNAYASTVTPAVEIGQMAKGASYTTTMDVQQGLEVQHAGPWIFWKKTDATANNGIFGAIVSSNETLDFFNLTDVYGVKGRILRLTQGYVGVATPAVEMGAVNIGSGSTKDFRLVAQDNFAIRGAGTTNPELFFDAVASGTGDRIWSITTWQTDGRMSFRHFADDCTTVQGYPLRIGRGYTSTTTPAVEIGAVVIGSGSSTVRLLAQNTIGVTGSNAIINTYASGNTSGSRAWQIFTISDGMLIRRMSDDFTTEQGRLISMKAGWSSATQLLLLGSSVGADAQFSGTMSYEEDNGEVLRTKIIDIGDWNMDATPSKGVVHGLTDNTKIRHVDVWIRDDSGNIITPLRISNSIAMMHGGIADASSTQINLYRLTGGYYDATTYNSTSYNRGWVYITYIE